MGLSLSLLGLKVTVPYAAITYIAAVLTGAIWEMMGLADEYKQVTVHRGSCSYEDTEEITEIRVTAVTTGIKIRRAGEMAWSLFRQILPYLLLGAVIYGPVSAIFSPSLWRR